MMQKIKNFIFLPLSIVLIIVSCTKTSSTVSIDTSGNWVKKSEFDGNVRTGAISFTIGDTAYIGTGYDGSIRYNDLWAYDPIKNYWIQRASLPGVARNSAVGFTIGTKGYISTGFDGINKLSDTWEFDPATNSWKQKADFAGTARYSAVAFGINQMGYVTTGFDGGYTKDLWQFSPNAGANGIGSWSQLPSLSGSKRSGAVSFVSNNKAYVLTGINNGTTVSDFWVFDPSNTSTPWTQLRDIANTSTDTYDDIYTDIVRSNAVAFTIGSKAYLTVGENGSYTKTTWEYDIATDLWVRKTPYERLERSGAVAFTVQGRGFLCCGRNSTYYFDNIDEFLPNITENVND